MKTVEVSTEKKVPDYIPNYLRITKPFKLWYEKYRKFCPYKVFLQAYEFVRLGCVEINRSMIRNISSDRMTYVLIGQISKCVSEKDRTYSFIIEPDHIVRSICDCEAHYYSRELCKHIIAGIILAVEKYKIPVPERKKIYPYWLDPVTSEPLIQFLKVSL